MDDPSIFNLTVAMEIIPASCDHDIPLINITLLNESAPGMYVLAISYLANGFIQKHI